MIDKNKEIIQIVKDSFNIFKKYFKSAPKMFFGLNCLTIEFETKKTFSRSVDLNKFEEIIEKLVNRMSLKFKKKNIDCCFWAAGSCDIQFTLNR